MATTRQESGILVLLDMVEYTPQVLKLGDEKAAQLDQYLTAELKKRATPRGFEFIKTVGDAALLFGTSPEGLIELMLDLFSRDRIPPHLGFSLKLRMLAHHGFIHFLFDDADRRIDVAGLEAIKEFRIEKWAETWRLVVTEPLYRGVQHLLEKHHIEHRVLAEVGPLKGLETFGSHLLHKLIPWLPVPSQTIAVSAPTAEVGSPTILIVWDPEILSPSDYAELVTAIGDLVRSQGGVGIKRLKSRGFGVPVESEVLT